MICPKEVKNDVSLPHLELSLLLDRWSELIALYPRLGQEFNKAIDEEKLDKISLRKFQISKERLITINICLKEQKTMETHEREALVKMVLEQGHVPTKDRPGKKSIVAYVVDFFTSKSSAEADNELSDRARAIFSSTTDAQFLSELQEIRSREALLETEVTTVVNLAHQHFQAVVKKRLNVLFAKFQQIQEQDCRMQIHNLAASRREEGRRALRHNLVEEMQETTADNS
jgi:hypothetical protein